MPNVTSDAPVTARRTRAKRPLDPDGCTSWTVIADALGTSEREVRRIYASAIAKARAALLARGLTLDDFVGALVARDTTASLDLPEVMIPEGEEMIELSLTALIDGDDED